MERIEFIGSGKSHAATARKALWSAALVALVISVLGGGIGPGAVLGAAITLGMVLLVDILAIRPALAGRLIAVVDADGIESRFFDSKTKRYRWEEIDRVEMQGAGGRSVQFVLRALPGRPDKRRFLNGLNPCRPKLALGGLDAQDHARLVAILLDRIGALRGDAGREQLAAFQEEAAFRQQLAERVPVPTRTYALVAANVAAWLWTLTAGAAWDHADARRLLELGGNSAFQVQHGEWWRLLTAAFLHNGFMHVAMNMIGLLAMGPLLERLLRPRQFLLVYFGSALAGSAASLHFGAQSNVSVGASGAVFGVAGALLATFLFHRRHMPKAFSKRGFVGMALFVGYNLLQGAGQPSIDNAAHVGGLLAGALIAALSPLRMVRETSEETARRRGWVSAAAALLLVGVLASTAPAATVDQRQVFASLDTLQKAFVHLDRAGQGLVDDQKAVKAGRMTQLEADERSRTVHAPVFQSVLDEFRSVQLPPGHPALPLASTGTRMTQLVHEAMAMESDVVDGKPVPARPQRAKEIDAELKRLRVELERQAAEMKARR
jgi:rhomboid protease GluP